MRSRAARIAFVLLLTLSIASSTGVLRAMCGACAPEGARHGCCAENVITGPCCCVERAPSVPVQETAAVTSAGTLILTTLTAWSRVAPPPMPATRRHAGAGRHEPTRRLTLLFRTLLI